ncbi:AT-rich interactive domain-containing protein 2-like isoform X1 [Macrobrachium nipponense]|uniref:AT-rich interactive domain-containing protein 2-like isoform X1 n=1 Tax=Macrobrachium nipponense TaxID=159736 RepID=UPI0030C8435D
MSKDVNKDAEAYDREYDAFIKQLEDFHQQRGTPFRRLPRVNGKGVDLYLLYVVVTARGGWQKVNARAEWEDILEDFRLPPGCINSSTALKHIYIRYLDAYERVNFLGEDGEDRGTEMDEGEDSRSMRTKRTIRSLNNVPLSYNHQQHNVHDTLRYGAALSTDLYKASSYDKLALSLISPLPNEHDFAFNVCTILSNEGRHVLQLSQCPRLVEHMLGHTGVYKDWETQKYFLTNYKETRGRSLVQFWIDSVKDRSVLDLLIPETFDKPTNRPIEASKDSSSEHNTSGAIETSNTLNLSSESLANFDNETFLCCDTLEKISNSTCVANEASISLAKRVDSGSYDNLENAECGRLALDATAQALKKESILRRLEKVLECEGSDLKLLKEDGEIFHLGRDHGVQDAEGSRISQILHIIRNLSFEEQNVACLAKSHTCLRFLVLCMCSQWGGLAVNALDTLGNIVPEVTLRDPRIDSCSASLLENVCKGVASADRAFILRSLEVLNKLAMNDPNEEILNNYIEPSVYSQICRYLTIHDIMLLIYTLECLYSLSSLGTPACNAIVRAKGSIHTLISLLTVEAQSYGPEACIGMKVVETVTGVVSEPEPNTTAASATSTSTSTTTTSATATHLASATSTAVTTPVTSATIATTPIVNKTVSKTTPGGTATPGDAKKIASRIVPPEVEEFVIDWVRKNYEANAGNAIEQAIVYRHFAASMHAMGRKQGLNPVLLSNCVRKVFGTGVGPSRRPVEDGSEKWHYNGIRRRDGIVVPPMPEKKPVKVAGAAVPVFTPTPVLNTVSTINTQVSDIRINSPIVGTPQIVTAQAQPESNVSPSSPILKAQLSAPLRPSPPPPARQPQAMVSGTMSQGGYSSAQQTQTPPSPQQAQGSGRADNSALIKSLLANKVTPVGVNQAGSMDSLHPSPHSRSVLVPSAPQPPPPQTPQQQQPQPQPQQQQQQQLQQPRPPTATVSYVQALSQGPPGPQGPIHSPSSVGSNSGLQVVTGVVGGGGGGTTPGVFGVKGVVQGPRHQLTNPPVQVSRNLQKQLQQQPTDSSQDSSNDSQLRKTPFNGICNEVRKCEDDSNSFHNAGANEKKVTSFEGILQNGIKSDDVAIKEEELSLKVEESSVKEEDTSVAENKTKKNVLADLLERTVGGEILNGVVDRELRISDKGLEFVNHGQQLKINGPFTANGQTGVDSPQVGGIKRPATPDNSPVKRMALEDPRGAAESDSRITLYVSQNGSESGEVISQGQQHQVVITQGQQPGNVAVSNASPQMVVSQTVLPSQQQVGTAQTVVTPQGQVILQRSAGAPTGVIVQQGGQIITQGSGAGQVIQQMIQGQSGQPQKVILHQSQLGQVIGGQVILSQGGGGQHQVVVQGGNNIQGQVIMQSVPHCQGQVFMQGSSAQGQFVVGGSQAQQVMVSSAQGQTMIVTGSQGQPVVVSGQQGASGQVVVPSNVGGTVLLTPHQQGSTAKTLIILPNPKMVLAGSQHQSGQGQQLVLPRQVAGQQVVQVVSSGTTGPVATVTTAMRTIRTATPITDNRAVSTPPPPPVQHASANSNSSSSNSNFSVQTSANLPTAVAPAPAGPTAVPVSQTIVSQGPQTPHVPAPQVLSSGVARRQAKPSGLQYLCEWRGCNRAFSSAAQVYHHACKIHCPPYVSELQCGWAGCDTMTRRRFSAMTHLHDRHCNEQLLHILAVRRSQLASAGKTEIPIPQAPPPHPGYAPNAAFHAIKRHALEVINHRDAVEKEGPVTKSIRLTSALILRNLVIYSNTGKKLLRGYESELSNVAISTMESSRTVAQILYDISLPDHQGM